MKTTTWILSFSLCLAASFAMGQGSVMLVTEEGAEAIIDGVKPVSLKPYSPEKVVLSAGEHSVHATSVQGVEIDRKFTVEEGKQKLIQLTFPAYVPPPPPRKEPLKPVTVYDGKVKATVSQPYEIGDPHGFMEVSERYFTFAKGDTLIIEAQSEQKKGNFFVEFIKYTDWSPAEYKEGTGQVDPFKMVIERTEIYIVRVGAKSTEQDVKLTIQRIPASEASKEFDTETEKYVLFDVVGLLDPELVQINSTSHEKWQGGKNETAVPLEIGADITEWYYIASMNKEREEANQVIGQFSLLDDIKHGLGKQEPIPYSEAKQVKIDLEEVKQPPGNATCDIYLLTHENAQKFNSEEMFVYITEGSEEAVESVKKRIQCCMGGHYYLGVRNKDVYAGAFVVMEAVGIRKGMFLERPVDRARNKANKF